MEAVGELTADDPLIRNPAMDLVMKLIRAGKGAFFINEGLPPEMVYQLQHAGQH